MITREQALNLLDSLKALDSGFTNEHQPYRWSQAMESVVDGVTMAYPDYVSDKEMALELISMGDNFSFHDCNALSPELFQDRDVALAIVRSRAHSGVFASKPERLQPYLQDSEVLNCALIAQGSLYQSLPDEMRADQGLACLAVGNGGLGLDGVEEPLKKDRTVVLQAIEKNPFNLKFADKSFRAETDMALEAVLALSKKETPDLKHFFNDCVSRSLRNNKDFMVRATMLIPDCFRYAFAVLRQDPDLMRAYAKGGGRVFHDKLTPEMANDPALMLDLIKNAKEPMDPFNSIGTALQDDKDFALATVGLVKYSVIRFSQRLQDDVDVVRSAVAHNPQNLSFASFRIQNDPALLEEPASPPPVQRPVKPAQKKKKVKRQER